MAEIDHESNIQYLRSAIAGSCSKSNRDPSEIEIVAVSKTQDAEAIDQVHKFGIDVFGENKAQELIAKADQCNENIQWHFIGQLQTNKLKKIASRVTLIHSIDSEHQLDILAPLENMPDLLIQLSADGNENRGGVTFEKFEPLLNYARSKELNVVGVMHVPLPEIDPRSSFDTAYKCAENFALNVISMGMSADFELAIEHGSTMIRVGSAVFGPRTDK